MAIVRYCENHFCLYWQDMGCVLAEISLDIKGSCESCFYIEPEKEAFAIWRALMWQKLEKEK